MDATNKIIVLAKELGEALKESKEYTDFCDAKKAMRENTVLKAKLDEFKVQKAILEVEQEKPESEKDEHLVDMLSSRVEVLYKEINGMEAMKKYAKAEEDLNILMTAVNMTISSFLGAEEYANNANFDEDCEDEGSDGCTHNCATCRGCH